MKQCNAAWFSVPFRRQRSVVRGPVGWGKGVDGGSEGGVEAAGVLREVWRQL